jgi:hypothetical protein
VGLQTKFDATDSNTTNRPSAEIAGSRLLWLAGWPPGPTDTRLVTWATRSRTNTPAPGLRWASRATRFDADDLNTTNRPCAEIAGSKLQALACWPAGPTDTRRVSCALRSRTNTSAPRGEPREVRAADCKPDRAGPMPAAALTIQRVVAQPRKSCG